MESEKLNEFSLLKELTVRKLDKKPKFGQGKNRLFYLVKYLKDPYDVYEFIIALLSLNIIKEGMYQIFCG